MGQSPRRILVDRRRSAEQLDVAPADQQPRLREMAGLAGMVEMPVADADPLDQLRPDADLGELVGRDFDNAAQTLKVKRSLVDQLAELNVKPEQIETIGISHWHFDHVGQAGRFPQAKLLIGKGDLQLLRATPPVDEDSAKGLAHWLTGGGKLEEVTADKDVFGDGRVVMLKLPGHTPGHYALLVRLASGPVLLSGDQYHFTEQVKNRGVPPFNHDRADTLASSDRFDRIAANLKAKVVIQHEPADIAKLPAFPKSAR